MLNGTTTGISTDVFGNPMPAELTRALGLFSQGPVGQSPATASAIQSFQNQTLPIIQQQWALQGLRGSPGLGLEAGRQLGGAITPLIQEDMRSRLAAIQMLQQQGQEAASLRQQGLLGFGQLAQGQQQLGMQGLGAAGQAQQGVAQQALEQQQAERLRQQALAEQANIGIFGGAVIPPQVTQFQRGQQESKGLFGQTK